MSGRLCIVLTALLACSALSLVNAQYQARRLFIEIERAQAVTRQLEVEWSQLQLDQSTLGKHARTLAQGLLCCSLCQAVSAAIACPSNCPTAPSLSIAFHSLA